MNKDTKMKKPLLAIPLGVAVILLIFPFAVYSGSQIMTVTSDSMVPTLKPNGKNVPTFRYECNHLNWVCIDQEK